MKDTVHIRPYKQSDRKSIESIYFDTGFLGKSLSPLVDNKKSWTEALDHYFTKEPESIFIAESSGKIIGYLIGCLDDKKSHETRTFLISLIKNLLQYPHMSRKDRSFWNNRLLFLPRVVLGLSGELNFKVPPNAGHLHINLLPACRGIGIGTKLLNAFEHYARKQGMKVIHADSFETPQTLNKHFWLKNGFTEYSRVKTQFWEPFLPTEHTDLVCYVKRLDR